MKMKTKQPNNFNPPPPSKMAILYLPRRCIFFGSLIFLTLYAPSKCPQVFLASPQGRSIPFWPNILLAVFAHSLTAKEEDVVGRRRSVPQQLKGERGELVGKRKKGECRTTITHFNWEQKCGAPLSTKNALLPASSTPCPFLTFQPPLEHFWHKAIGTRNILF
jgi:hypothetical protein